MNLIKSSSIFFLGVLTVGSFPFSVSAEENQQDSGVSASVQASTTITTSPLRFLDRREDVRDRREDHRDRAEDRIDAATTTGPRDRVEDVRDHREDVRDHREDRRESFRENFPHHGVQNHLDRFTRILSAAIGRMEQLTVRIDARADALDAEGKNTTEARSHLAVALDELADAKNDLATLNADLEASLGITASTTPEILRQTFAGTKAVIESAKAHVRAAHQAIRDAVLSLKAAVSVEAEVE